MTSRVFEVFVQWKAGEPHVHVGEVEADDHETALLAAKEHFARRDRCAAIWVAAREDVHVATWDQEVRNSGHRKMYRRALGTGADADVLAGRI